MNYSVSVLTPSYNQGRFLDDCITSVSNQTYRPIEHIVCDGGSTDGTLEVLRSAPEHVRWVSERDGGQSHALNKALAMSSGDIVGWVNSDDAYADRRAVESAVATFEAHPDVGVVYGHSVIVSELNKVLQVWWSAPHHDWLLPRMTPFAQPAVFLRRSVLPEPFVREDLRFVMDRDLWLRLAGHTRFMRIDRVVGVDRHQLERKTLSPAYLEEREWYRRNGRGKPASGLPLKAMKIAMRVRGAVLARTLHRDLSPALPLIFDSPRQLLTRQFLVPRRYMQRGPP